MTKSRDERIEDAARGFESTISIYWDNGDPDNTGPAWSDDETGETGTLRTGSYERAAREDEGPLLNDWVYCDDDEIAGYSLVHYFGGDGSYLGPNTDGISPQFSE